MMERITVKDLMENNENQRTRVDKKVDDILSETLWEGMLHEVPEELHQMPAYKVGWSLKEQMNVIYV